jgi:hypothetical protein
MVAEHLTNDGAQVDGLCLLDGAAPDQILYQGESPPSPSLLRSWALGALGEIAGPPLISRHSFSWRLANRGRHRPLQKPSALILGGATLFSLRKFAP